MILITIVWKDGRDMNIWDNGEMLDRMESERDARRKRMQRITFDCLELKCRGDRAVCSKGLYLGQARDGSMGLVTVLRGVTSGSCLHCSWFRREIGEK